MFGIFDGGLDDQGGTYTQYIDCVFLRDFGPWFKGDAAEVIAIEYDSDGVILMKEYEDGEENDPIRECEIKIIAV